MEELSSRYPAKYDVQLMALADFFESKFGKASLGPAKLLDEKSFARKLGIPVLPVRVVSCRRACRVVSWSRVSPCVSCRGRVC
jgi:hypothetical protein